MSDEYTLLIYRGPVPFVLVEPGGVTVLTVKSHAGKVVYTQNGWQHQQKWGFLRRFAGQEAVGSVGEIYTRGKR